jgi:prepilin-type N-terminal cleavage/methylation domain-containing protein
VTTSVTRAPRRHGDDGFTLVELLVVMAIMSVLLGLSVGAYRSYATTQAHRGAADGVVALLREAHQSAITEGVAYSVKLPDDGPWTMHRGSLTCSGPATGAVNRESSRVSLTNVSKTCVAFRPRGTATAGSLDVVRTGSSKVYSITVEGLTGRATLS